MLRMFRNISHSKLIDISISSEEVKEVHSLQKLFSSEATIDEIELIAEIIPESKLRFDVSIEKQLSQRTNPLLATLKIPRIKIDQIFPAKSVEGHLTYHLSLNLRGGSSLVSY